MPPREVVVRACDLAGEMTDELLKRGWLKDNPGEKALWPEAFAKEEETAKAKKWPVAEEEEIDFEGRA
jgi:hypothetical protein